LEAPIAESLSQPSERLILSQGSTKLVLMGGGDLTFREVLEGILEAASQGEWDGPGRRGDIS
jgi:hypothetical protein